MSQQVTVDDEGQLRLLPQDDLQKVTDLGQSCDKFVTEISEFASTVDSITSVMSQQAEKIEKAKVQAIGEQMRLQCEEEFRKREQQRLQQMLLDTKTRAQRLNAELVSVSRVLQQQQQLKQQLLQQ